VSTYFVTYLFAGIIDNFNHQCLFPLKKIELKHIIEILEMTGWSVHGNGGSAELLEIKPTTLEARMKKLKIERKR